MKFIIRELRPKPEDFAAAVEIDNAVNPEHRYTAEQFRYDYENFDTRKYIMRYYLVEANGKVLGYTCYYHMPYRFHPQRFWVWVAVHPAFQKQGIGSALYDRIFRELRELSVRWLHTSVRETWVQSQKFLEKRGFREVRRSWESHLDVSKFNFSSFWPQLEGLAKTGITITTLAEEKERSEGWLSKIHELHNLLMADVPSSAPPTPVPLEHFQRFFIQNPDLLPEAFFIAKDGDLYVGESFVFRVPAEPGHLSQGLTGVRREYRGKGIAMALKLRVIKYAKEHGYTLIKTWNDTENLPILALNEKLGFVRQPAWIEYEKVLP